MIFLHQPLRYWDYSWHHHTQLTSLLFLNAVTLDLQIYVHLLSIAPPLKNLFHSTQFTTLVIFRNAVLWHLSLECHLSYLKLHEIFLFNHLFIKKSYSVKKSFRKGARSSGKCDFEFRTNCQTFHFAFPTSNVCAQLLHILSKTGVLQSFNFSRSSGCAVVFHCD